MSISLKRKRAAVEKTFGIPVDPEEVEFIDFMFARRRLATVPGRRGREPAYLAEILDTEEAYWQTLDRIRERDGEKIFREAATYLREAVDSMSERRPRASTKANGAAARF